MEDSLPEPRTVPRCPLCGNTAPRAFERVVDREYWQCVRCALVFLTPEQRPTLQEERVRYGEHQNEPDNPGYVEFLRRLGDPVVARTTPGARGLDYGSGATAVLAHFLTRSGRPTVGYDPMFLPRDELLDVTYDFVTCTEVLEHAHDPAALLDRVATLLRPGGLFAAMTSFRDASVPFANWHYRRDPTHVSFYDADTMRWIAADRGWTLELPAPNVALFTTG